VLAGTSALYLLGNVLIDPTFAALSGFALWSVTAYLEYLGEERARRQAANRIMLMRQEAVLAGRMQQAILPRRFPSFADIAIHAEAHPAAEVGGDFYDVFELPGGRLAFLIADVAGKGMASALFMAVARTVVRATAPTAADDPALCLTRANALLAADNEAVMFVTLFYGVLDPTLWVLDYANAGHNPPLLLAAEGTVRRIEPTGDPPLGVLEGVAYAGRRLPLAGGDTLFLYTDGVTEAFAPDGRAYGEDRLRRRLQGLCGLAPRQVTEQVVADVASFARGAEPSDDLTCLAVTVGM
jgi:sigma-B regulation protein RsbU (phosphoserine phosphatase)